MVGRSHRCGVLLAQRDGDGFREGKGFSDPDILWATGVALLRALHRTIPATCAVTLKLFYWPSQEFLDSDDELPQLENDYGG